MRILGRNTNKESLFYVYISPSVYKFTMYFIGLHFRWMVWFAIPTATHKYSLAYVYSSIKNPSVCFTFTLVNCSIEFWSITLASVTLFFWSQSSVFVKMAFVDYAPYSWTKKPQFLMCNLCPGVCLMYCICTSFQPLLIIFDLYNFLIFVSNDFLCNRLRGSDVNGFRLNQA